MSVQCLRVLCPLPLWFTTSLGVTETTSKLYITLKCLLFEYRMTVSDFKPESNTKISAFSAKLVALRLLISRVHKKI